MTTDINITPMEQRTFGVEITEGTTTTSHEVSVPEETIELVTTQTDDVEVQQTLVRESVLFLLEREPADEILARFSLDDIPRYFPDYKDEIVRRMS